MEDIRETKIAVSPMRAVMPQALKMGIRFILNSMSLSMVASSGSGTWNPVTAVLPSISIASHTLFRCEVDLHKCEDENASVDDHYDRG